MCAVAFVPPQHVQQSFDHVCGANFEEVGEVLDRLLDYFAENYVTGRVVRGVHRKPLFPVAQWNMCAAVLDKLPRTINTSEGWHSKLRSCQHQDHPPLSRALTVMKEMMAVDEGRRQSCAKEEKTTIRVRRRWSTDGGV